MKHYNKFWKNKKLEDFTKEEWEALCDGCGKCCLHKLLMHDKSIKFTNVACKLLDLDTCLCSKYKIRKDFVPDCVSLTPKRVIRLKWLPKTCAYRLIKEGKDLPPWHYLVCGDKDAVHHYMMSAKDRVISELVDNELEEHIVEWEDL